MKILYAILQALFAYFVVFTAPLALITLVGNLLGPVTACDMYGGENIPRCWNGAEYEYHMFYSRHKFNPWAFYKDEWRPNEEEYWKFEPRQRWPEEYFDD